MSRVLTTLLGFIDNRASIRRAATLDAGQATANQGNGPYYVPGSPDRRDVREDREGAPLLLRVRAVRAGTLTPLAGAMVEIWHCDANGIYSGYQRYRADKFPALVSLTVRRFRPTDDGTFLRGRQTTDGDGYAEFQTIVPGWYTPRTLHIHVRVSLAGRAVLGTELYFPDDFAARIQSLPPYAARGRGPYRNTNDIEIRMAKVHPAAGRRCARPGTATGPTSPCRSAADFRSITVHTRTAVITGAAGGLGQATARQLLAAGFDVIAVTRDAHSAQAVRQTLTAYAPGRTIHALHADLVDRDDVRALAARLRDTVERIDVLINNAGAAFPRYAETADGVERTHALNHLAPFQLTHLLLAGGSLAPDARIITIASDLVSRGRLDAAHPDVTGVSWRDTFSQLTVYGTAKLAGVLATTALAARLPAGMTAYSANPGVIRTGFNTKSGGLLRVVSSVSGLFAQAPDKAARTPVLLAVAPSAPVPNGGFFAKGVSAPAPDPARAAAVYERTSEVLGGAISPLS